MMRRPFAPSSHDGTHVALPPERNQSAIIHCGSKHAVDRECCSVSTISMPLLLIPPRQDNYIVCPKNRGKWVDQQMTCTQFHDYSMAAPIESESLCSQIHNSTNYCTNILFKNNLKLNKKINKKKALYNERHIALNRKKRGGHQNTERLSTLD